MGYQGKEISAAQSRVYYALKRGELRRPTRCSKCGRRGFIEAAHVSYGKRLAIVWLCRSCHRRWDRRKPKARTIRRGSDFRRAGWKKPRPKPRACPAGHPYTGANRYVDPKGVFRCRRCRREGERKRRLSVAA